MNEQNFGIVPSWFYRKSDAETHRIIGLKLTAIDDAIDAGLLPPPASAVGLRGCGWQGFQLIEYIRARIARAQAEHDARTKKIDKPKKKKVA
jgi:hypothetical protein